MNSPLRPLARTSKHIIIVAGEASGDMHAAQLVEEIKKLNPRISFSGLGGEKMQASGVKLYEDITGLAVIGFVEVLKHYKELKKAFSLILRKIEEVRPDAVILVDYPGFNLRLAKEIKKRNIRVIYYISPQVWAWKENRVRTIRECTDKLFVFFDFEKKFYAGHHLETVFVGHPLIDGIKVTSSREKVLSTVGLSPEKLTVGILPGSRQKEIERILPPMLEAAKILSKNFPQIQFLLVKAPTIERATIENYLKNYSLPLKIVEPEIYNGIHACDVCMVASGTATLETAILNKPMVVVYKTSLFTWLLAKLFIKLSYIGLVNVVAGKKIVPECLQFQATGQHIAEKIKGLITDEIKIAEMKTALAQVKASLGPGGASRRAAEEILKII